MNGIQQIGFANTIIATNSNDFLIKAEGPVRVIFELEKWYRLYLQHEAAI